MFFINGWGNSNGVFDDGNWCAGSGYTDVYFTENDNFGVSSSDRQIIKETHNNKYYLYFVDNAINHYLSVKLVDGTVINEFSEITELLYYILCQESELLDTTNNSSLGSSIGNATSTVNNYYTTKNDIFYNYYSEVSAASAAGTLATGTDSDVKITTAALTSSVVGTDTLTNVGTVTDVQSAVETTTGETISFSPSITCMNGINLIRISTGGIRDKFPFAVVYVLRDSFNVFEATRETPVFTIPLRFNIAQLVSIDEDFVIDLSDLDTIAAIARWGELGALGIALAILTKRMLF